MNTGCVSASFTEETDRKLCHVITDVTSVWKWQKRTSQLCFECQWQFHKEKCFSWVFIFHRAFVWEGQSADSSVQPTQVDSETGGNRPSGLVCGWVWTWSCKSCWPMSGRKAHSSLRNRILTPAGVGTRSEMEGDDCVGSYWSSPRDQESLNRGIVGREGMETQEISDVGLKGLWDYVPYWGDRSTTGPYRKSIRTSEG